MPRLTVGLFFKAHYCEPYTGENLGVLCRWIGKAEGGHVETWRVLLSGNFNKA